MKYSYRLLIVLVLGVIIWKCFQYFIIKETKETNGSIKLLENVYQDNQGKIRISVFYEALCSDSRFFILKQLVPAYEALPGYITLDLVPYGKAQVYKTFILQVFVSNKFCLFIDHRERWSNILYLSAWKFGMSRK